MGTAIENNLFADYIFFIPSGGTTSTKLYHEDFVGTVPANYIENPRLCLVGIFTPGALTSTAITIQVSHDGTNWVSVYAADGTAFSMTAAASRYIAIPPSVSFGWGYIRLVGGTAEAGDRSIVARFQVV
jgi:hypothetical protein